MGTRKDTMKHRKKRNKKEKVRQHHVSRNEQYKKLDFQQKCDRAKARWHSKQKEMKRRLLEKAQAEKDDQDGKVHI